MSQAHCPQCGFEFEWKSNIRSTALHRAIWSLGVIALGALGFVALYAILDGVLPTVVDSPPGLSARKKTEVDISAIDSALEEFAIASGGKFPDGLHALVTPDVNGRTFLDQNHVPKDPWGREYFYEPPGPGQPQPIIRSYGKDGQPGGEGDDADIDNLSLRRESVGPQRRLKN